MARELQYLDIMSGWGRAWQTPAAQWAGPCFGERVRADHGLCVGPMLCLVAHGAPGLGSEWGRNTRGLPGSQQEGRLGPIAPFPKPLDRHLLDLQCAPES